MNLSDGGEGILTQRKEGPDGRFIFNLKDFWPFLLKHPQRTVLMLHKPRLVQFQGSTEVQLVLRVFVLMFYILESYTSIESWREPQECFLSISLFLQMRKEAQLAQGHVSLMAVWICSGHLTFQALSFHLTPDPWFPPL